MRLAKRGVLPTVLLLVIALTVLPGTGLAGDDNDNTKKDNKPGSSRQTTVTSPAGKPSGAVPGSSPQTTVNPAPDTRAAPGSSQSTTVNPAPDTRSAAADLYVRYSASVDDQTYEFEIYNDGGRTSVPATVTIVTVSPEPTPWSSDVKVPALDSGAHIVVRYKLHDPCNGHVVRATLDLNDKNRANNTTGDLALCGVKLSLDPSNTPSVDLGPKDTVTGPINGRSVDHGAKDTVTDPINGRSVGHGATDAVTDPIVDRSVDHGPFTWPLKPVAFKTLSAGKDDGRDTCRLVDGGIVNQTYNRPFPLMAGFRNFASEQAFGDCQANAVWQAAFRFDLAEIRGEWAAGRLVVVDMALTFEETPFGHAVPNQPGHWSPPGGPADGDRTKSVPTHTCWPRLTRPTVDWSGSAQLVPNEALLDAKQIGSFPLLGEVSGQMLMFPDNDMLGFLILGHNEEMHFNNAACVSQIEAVKLIVTYATP